ncbi:MAG TPA: DUF2461 domain-containing protein [Vicinamibacterales bacterium]|nr:DUF2461 domain-containing protein [Vicinamibacterales bacterium]
MPAPAPRFTAQTLKFLRALKRNNRREWFNAHRDDYEAHVRAPMTATVERLALDFRSFAPELVASPKVSIYRIYRDTRFSENKAPYKTHAAAVFPTRGLAKHEGAGLYFHVSHEDVWIGGGMYAPPPPQLHAVRAHIAANVRQLRAIVESPAFRRRVTFDGEKLTRVPRGFPKDHEAAEYLKFRYFIAGAEFPAEFAASPKFYSTVLAVFREVLPLSRFLNQPLAKR